MRAPWFSLSHCDSFSSGNLIRAVHTHAEPLSIRSDTKFVSKLISDGRVPDISPRIPENSPRKFGLHGLLPVPHSAMLMLVSCVSSPSSVGMCPDPRKSPNHFDLSLPRDTVVFLYVPSQREVPYLSLLQMVCCGGRGCKGGGGGGEAAKATLHVQLSNSSRRRQLFEKRTRRRSILSMSMYLWVGTIEKVIGQRTISLAGQMLRSGS